METLLASALVIAILAFVVWISIILPYQMARKRNRSAIVWVLVSLLVSPLVSIIVLAIMGDAEPKEDISETFA